MTTKQPSHALLRSLAERAPTDDKVVTIYLDLDPSRYATPRARESQLTSLINEAEQGIDADGLDHDGRERLKQTIQRVQAFLDEQPLPADGAGALAIFASGGEIMDTVALPKAVEPTAYIGDAPVLAPMARFVGREDWCVLCINSSTARILRGTADALTELDVIEDEVHRRHSQGGWSQARFQRSVDKEIGDHRKHVADRLLEIYEQAPFDCLAVATTEEMFGEVQDSLHPYVRERLCGRISVDVQHSTLEQIVEALAPLAEDVRAGRERELMERLSQEIGRGERGVMGAPDVMRALEERRVETLLVAPNADGIDRAIDLALQQSAEVFAVKSMTQLQDGVGAILRF